MRYTRENRKELCDRILAVNDGWGFYTRLASKIKHRFGVMMSNRLLSNNLAKNEMSWERIDQIAQCVLPDYTPILSADELRAHLFRLMAEKNVRRKEVIQKAQEIGTGSVNASAAYEAIRQGGHEAIQRYIDAVEAL
jgi:nicotinamide mononucleotide adenylyltransferase